MEGEVLKDYYEITVVEEYSNNKCSNGDVVECCGNDTGGELSAISR